MAGPNLKNFQLEAIGNMHNGCILCGGVGSGKSRTSLGYYYEHQGGDLKNPDFPLMKEPKNLFIITTARKRDEHDWEKELGLYYLSTDANVNGYSNTVIVDSWNNIKKYEKISGAFFIFDEQRVVGKGVWTKSFDKICHKNEWILLSATPGDRWTDYIPVFVANDFYKNRSEFIEEHVIYKRFSKFPQVDRYVNTGRLIQLRKRILVYMDFNRPTTRHHIDVFVDYDRSEYKQLVHKRRNPITQKPMRNAAELCSFLRKTVNTDPSRLNAVLDIIKSHPKVIIFYNNDYELDLLRKLDYGPNVEVAEWNGHAHNEIPYCESWVYLVQYTAGAEGWNCVQTDTIIFYSLSYSYKVMEQSCGRIDRMNTPYTDLYYYHLKSKAPIDISIQRALDSKKQFSESAFAGKHFKNN